MTAARVRNHRNGLRSLACAAVLALAGAVLLGACSRGPGRPDAAPPLTVAVAFQDSCLRDPSPAPEAGVVRRFLRLEQALSDPQRRAAAADTLFREWEADPGHFLWIELAVTRYRFLGDPDRYDAQRARIERDSTGVAAAFLQARRFWGRRDDAEQGFRDAAARPQELTPLQSVWLEQRLARLDSDAGDPDAAVARLLRTLPRAQRLGGPGLAGRWWRELCRHARRAGRLDDAATAADLAHRCAAVLGEPGQELTARLELGRCLSASRRTASADSLFALCEREALALQDPALARELAVERAIAARADGDLPAELAHHRRSVAHALRSGDPDAVVKSAAALANAHRRGGALDSAAVWLERARSLGGEDPTPSSRSILARVELLLLIQQGRYAESSRLLSQDHGFAPIDIALDLVRQGLETGRVDLVHRGLAVARQHGTAFVPSSPDYHPRLSLALESARALARQGDFPGADRQLAVADSLARHGASAEERLMLAQRRGRVALLAGDPAAAVTALESGLASARDLGEGALLQRTRLRLAEALLLAGRGDRAEEILRGLLHVPSYWTRVHAALSLGSLTADAGRMNEAQEFLDTAERLLRPDSPRPLRLRLHLGRARLLEHAGRPRDALRALLAAAPRSPSPEAAGTETSAFDEHLHRRWAEALVGLMADLGEPAAASLEHHARVSGWDRGGSTAAWADLLRPASDGDVCLVFFLGEDRSFRWTGTRAGWSLDELPPRPWLDDACRVVRADLGRPDGPRHTRTARELADALLGSAAVAWRPDGALVLAADGPLGGLPWPALPWPDPESGEASMLIHHGELRHLAGLMRDRCAPDATDEPRLLAIGADGRGASRLRHAAAEAADVAAAWPTDQVTLLTSDRPADAPRPALDWSSYDVIHLASHARITEGLPGLSTLRLEGLGRGLPMTIAEVAELPLTAELVVLTSCETVGNAGTAGDGLGGFARAFLHAGAGAVLASTHLVADESARDLAARFYRSLHAGRTPAAALREAQRGMAAADSRWRHPAHWAFFRVLAPEPAPAPGRATPASPARSPSG